MSSKIIEYAGYVAPKATDWDTVLGEVETDLVGQVNKRVKQRETDLNIQQETEAAINDFTTGVSQDFSDYVSRGVEANRNLMMTYTNQLRSNKINSTQYKMLMNRVTNDWKQFGEFSNDFEKRLAEMETRNKDGKSSVIELWNGERIASAADFKNKQLVPQASSGGLFSVTTGKDGKPIKSEIINMNQLNNFRAQLVDKQDLQATIKSITDKAGNFKSVIGDEPIESVEGISKRLAERDPKLLQDYNNLIDGIYNTVLTGPPNQVASNLADNILNDKNQKYFTYQEGDLDKGGRFEGRDAEDGVKMIQESDGNWGAQLTDGQKQRLREKSKAIADTQLGFEEVYLKDKLDREKLDLEEAKLEEAKRKEIAAEKNKLKLAIIKNKPKTGDTPTEPEYKPYTQLLESFESKDASRVTSNPKVIEANYNKNGTELIVYLKGTDKNPDGGSETYSTTDKEGQKAISRLMNPDLDQAEIDELFDKDYNSYVDDEGNILKQEDRKQVARDEVIVIEETDFTQKITKKGKKTPSDYSFEEFIKNKDLGDKLTYTKDVALNTGILDLKDIDNLDIEKTTVGDDPLFMKLSYTLPDGKKIESDPMDSDPFFGFGDLEEEGNKDIFENFLQELRRELYFKGEAPKDKKTEEKVGTNVEIDENL
jgi:hypothetical protein